MAPETDAATTPRDDAELMRRVHTGDETAFAALMQRWEVPVKSVIARIVLNSSEAEDLAQETFVRLWQNRDRYTAGRPVKPWILSIAVNLARNRLRWWKRRPVIALEDWTETSETIKPEEHAGTSVLEQAERAKAVRDAIATLPTDLREALVLFEYEQMSYATIADALGVSAKAVENRIARAKEKLRTALKSWA